MLYPLTRRQRGSLLRHAVCTCVLATSLMPFAAPVESRSDQTLPQRNKALGVPAVPGPIVYPEAKVRHDPFTVDETTDPGVGIDAPGFVLPPNAAVNAVPVVRAIVSGTVARALIDVAGRTVLVSAGSAIGDVHVVRIDAGGVLLDNGDRLRLDGSP